MKKYISGIFISSNFIYIFNKEHVKIGFENKLGCILIFRAFLDCQTIIFYHKNYKINHELAYLYIVENCVRVKPRETFLTFKNESFFKIPNVDHEIMIRAE